MHNPYFIFPLPLYLTVSVQYCKMRQNVREVRYVIYQRMWLCNPHHACIIFRRVNQCLTDLRDGASALCHDLQDYQKSGFLKSCRGTNGGYALNLKLAEISLYDLCAAIDPDILLLECMKEGYPCSMNSPKNPCLVHHEFCRLQNMLVQEMKQKSLAELFR